MLFVIVFMVLPLFQGELISSDTAIDAYNNQFYVVKDGVGYFALDNNVRSCPGRGQFWMNCEQIETIEDAFERTRNPVYGKMIGELIRGLNEIISGTEDWASWNKFNDDIMWGIIALVRSFRLTGNQTHLSQAEIQYNKVWQRGWDTANGGMYWNTDKQSKNACVNGPASIAGFLLGESTQHTGFQDQGRRAFEWLRNNLYNETSGEIADHQNADGSVAWQPFSYNQGTFIGAAVLYNQNEHQKTALELASKAAYWTTTGLTGQHTAGILNDEYSDNGRGDGCGFKGIFARWCGRYVELSKDPILKGWMTKNAKAAWSQKNSKAVSWTKWSAKTPEVVTSWECSSTLAILQTVPL